MVAHRTTLRGLGAPASGGGPTILQRVEQDFVGAVLDELAGGDGVRAVMRKVAGEHDADGVLRLYQPVHRTFHVALLEMSCDLNGAQPRLDPRKIESAGLVVRRLLTDEKVLREGGMSRRGARVPVLEGWVEAGKSLRGWQPLTLPGQSDFDPDPSRRPPRLSAGHPELDRLLMLDRRQAAPELVSAERWAERVSALFVAPPDVCAASGRTVLYGLVPVTSSELSEAPPRPASFDRNDPDIRAHLSGYLRSGINTPFSNLSDQAIPYVVAADANLEKVNPPLGRQLDEFLALVRQLTFEFGAFGGTGEGARLLAALDAITLTFAGPHTRGAGDFLREAKEVLVEGVGREQTPPRTLTFPTSWPSITAREEERLWDAIIPAMEARLSAVMPQEGRFEDLTRRYQVRAFARVRRDDGCPPELVWSAPSEFFKIVPWYENNEQVAPVLVSLPNPLQKGFLDKAKPNVSFQVPGGLFNLLQANDPKKMAGGEGQRPEGAGLALDWICGFNIPIITICAFIVLNIFLHLLNIIFWWLFIIKICIPIPKGLLPKNEP